MKSYEFQIKSILDTSCEFGLDTLLITEADIAKKKDHGNNYVKVRPSLVCHFLYDCL